ncbi:MAG: 5-methylthioadenosine/S-adenosylhomocysteine deaminase, partial [Gammaproteobacteria bacterium]
MPMSAFSGYYFTSLPYSPEWRSLRVESMTKNTSLTLIQALLLLIFSLFSLFVSAQTVDLIITADHIVTMDENNTVLKDAAIAIDDGIIVAIDSKKSIEKTYTARQQIAGTNRVLMPGLVNGHTHAAMTLFRGIADDLPLMEWLTKHIFPAEIRFVDPEFVRIGTQLACLEMIKGGTTTFVDMYFHPKETARVVDECGVRAIVSAAVIEQKSGYALNFDDAMHKAESF